MDLKMSFPLVPFKRIRKHAAVTVKQYTIRIMLFTNNICINECVW